MDTTSTQLESNPQPSLAQTEIPKANGIPSEPSVEIDDSKLAAASVELPPDESLPSRENNSPPNVQEVQVQQATAKPTSPVNPISPDLRQQDNGQPEPRESPSEMRLDINHALQYLDSVKDQFEDRPSTYSRFLDIMKEFKSQQIDTPVVIARVSELFQGHPILIEGFNTFLPAGYKIECSRDASQPDTITVTTPSGKVLRGTTSSGLITPGGGGGFTTPRALSPSLHVTPLLPPFSVPPISVDGQPNVISGLSFSTSIVSTTESPNFGQQDGFPVINTAAPPMPATGAPPINQAIDFVNRIKLRYADEPEVYRKFLDVLQGYQRESGALESAQVHHEVTRLFRHRAPDLLEEFRVFLPAQGDGGLIGLAQVGGSNTTGDNDRRKRSGYQDGHRRKRKASEKETQRDLGGKMSPPLKTKRPKHAHHHELAAPAVQARTYIANDEHIFFDRVKRSLENRETYDEFLKLINLFTQGMIDGQTLLQSSSHFLRDNDLLNKFRDIVGLDGKDSIPEPSVSLARVGWDRNMKAMMDMGYKTSYKRLTNPDTTSCSGRDSLCKAVLNDEYVLAPDVHSEDGGVIGHKKNMYEEALHRTEEERHEYDFHLEAIARTISVLEPIANKIALIPTQEERNLFKLKPNLGGVFKSIHQRVLKKIYGREAGLEVVAAMQDIPAVAIPVVLGRLRQKEEEWKRSQREWNKIWREVDKRNYYKSLDHQGITFKASDKKMVNGRFFVLQIETAREHERSKRASFIDPSFIRTRPKHQLEYLVDSPPVLQDAVKLCLSYLDRTQGQYSSSERRKIEVLLRNFPPVLFGLDQAQFDTNLNLPNDSIDSDGVISDEITSNADDAEEGSARPSRGKRGAVNGIADRDLRKKLLKSEQAKSTRSTRGDGDQSPRSRSRHQSPVVQEVSQSEGANPYGTRLSNGRAGKARQAVRNPSLFCNNTIFIFIRQLILLYTRLDACKQMAATAAARQANGASNDLQLGDISPSALVDQSNPAAHFYDHLLHMCEQLFDNEIESSTYEDVLRYMFGIKAFQMFTVDKLIAAIIKQAQSILTESKSQEVWSIIQKDRDNRILSAMESSPQFRLAVEKALDPEDHVFRINWVTDEALLTFALLGKEEEDIDDNDLLNERWRSYLDSYTKDVRTETVNQGSIYRPFLKRTMPISPGQKDVSDVTAGRSSVEIRVCTRTYRIFYVPDTWEYIWRKSDANEVARAKTRFDKITSKQKAWLRAFDDGGTPFNVSTADS